MWEKILAVNSFLLWPLSAVFFIYALGRLFFVWDWKMLVISIIFVAITTVAGVIISIIIET